MGFTKNQEFVVDIASDEYKDRLYGCWQGKNAGGTLGTPLEKPWGEEEPFDVWWYPVLQEGGLPNDDLEMQLVWLKALEEVGPEIKARDLSRYWLDHIGYNFDEYGLSKLNLKLGLEPPVSGNHNNWFVDCMGSPIRSEVWACVSPGAPRLAARYAYQDSICDHAGGEGVFGEMFNAALESAAFVLQDPKVLIDIALSYIPHECEVRIAIDTAVSAHEQGHTWQEARRAVLDATPHYNAQYAPINTGFQVIGLLYGRDFGEGICITVNCGYDTDSSGAAIGSYLGIMQGRQGLPAKWIEPLGSAIATNESWGGVKNLSAGSNPAPAELDGLVERLGATAGKVLRHHGLVEGTELRVRLEDLYADEGVKQLHTTSPNVIEFAEDDVNIAVDYLHGPVLFPNTTREVAVSITNRRLEPMSITASLVSNSAFRVESPILSLTLGPGASETLTWDITAGSAASLEMSNTGWLQLDIKGRPRPAAVPLVLLGAYALRGSEIYPAGEDVGTALSTAFPPEEGHGQNRGGHWSELQAGGHAQPLAEVLDRPGVAYLQTFVHSPNEREVWVVMDPSCPVLYWINGEAVGSNDEFRLIRPNQKSAEEVGGYVTLQGGWNEVLIKAYHDGLHPDPELHLAFSGPAPLNDYQYDLTRTRFPWSG